MIGLFFVCFSLFKPRVKRDENDRPYLPPCKLLYYENFTDPNVLDRWIVTDNYRYKGEWKVEQTFPLQTRKGEKAIVMKDKDVAHGISTKFRHPIAAPNETLVIQYEMRAQFLFTCSGAYMKIFSQDFNPHELSNETAHLFEFGPEKCGQFNQTRFNVFTTDESGKQVEHNMKRPHWIPIDEIAHLYTLIIRPDGTFETLIDNRSTRNGTFINDFNPPLFELETIDDPTDKKPDDWVDDIIIPDPNAVKPDDWDDDAPIMIPHPSKLTPPPEWHVDEPKMIDDPTAKKPKSWNDDTMGPWRPPKMMNPKCIRGKCGPYTPPKVRNRKAHGKWKPCYVPNPAYKGEWKPRQIPNPNYKGEKPEFVMPPITGLAFDLWTGHREFAFTNILIGTNESVIRKWNEEDFVIRQRRQVRSMKINYQWMNVDLPDDVPEPGILGFIAYMLRCIRRRWRAVKYKPIVIAVTSAILLVMIPVIILCCQLCDDPFDKIKVE